MTFSFALREPSAIVDFMSTETDAVAAADLELISHELCPYVHRAAIVLREKGVPYRIRYIDLKAKPPWFLAVSPRGKVPVLVAGGVPIFESAVIVEYLDETHPPHIVPASPLERARHRAWAEIVSDLLVQQWKLMVAASAADRETARRNVVDLLQRFEPEVRGPWFAGDALGIVDVAIAPAFFRFDYLDRWWNLGLYEGLPNVGAWRDRLVARPSVRETVIDGFEEKLRAYVAQL
jgi:glutathione S-transferase